MFRRTFLAASLFAFAATTARAADAPKLTFSQDGTDLVVQAKITVNASSHVLWTDTQVGGAQVTLRYHVFQCVDLYVRSQKQIELTWRIPNGKEEGVKFVVMDQFQPTTAQLKLLLPQLEKLAAEGEKLKRGAELKKD